MALAESGQRDEAIKLLKELEQESSNRYVPGAAFAAIYIGLNEKDEALNWLEKDVTDRSSHVTFQAIDPVYDDLRGEPRFKEYTSS